LHFSAIDKGFQPDAVMPLLVKWIKDHSITEFKKALQEVAVGITMTGQLKESNKPLDTEDIKTISAND